MLGRFGIVELEPCNQVVCLAHIKFIGRERVKDVNAEHILKR